MSSMMKLAGFLGVVAVLGGGAATAYAFSDTVKNQVKLTVSDPQEYFTWVCEKNTADAADFSAAGYQAYLTQAAGGSQADYSAELTLSDELRSMLAREVEETDAANSLFPLYDTGRMYSDIIASTERIGLHGSLARQGRGETESVVLSKNGTDILSLDLTAQGSDLLFRIPELTAKWISIDLGSMLDADAMNIRAYAEAPETLITPDELSGLITRYANAVTSGMTCTAAERNASVTIADTETKYNIMTVDLTAEQVRGIGRNLLDLFENDTVIRSICIDKLKAVTAEEYAKKIADAREELNSKNLRAVSAALYTDGAGNIRAMQAVTPENDTLLIGAALAEGSLVAEYSVAYQGDSTRETLSARESADGWNGIFRVSSKRPDADEQTLTAAFSHVKLVDAKKACVSGDIQITAPEIESLTVKLDTDGTTETVSFPVYTDDKLIGDAVFTYTLREGGAELPDTSDRFAYVPDAEEKPHLSEYVGAEEVQQFVQTVLTNLGAQQEDADSFAQMLAAILYWQESPVLTGTGNAQ